MKSTEKNKSEGLINVKDISSYLDYDLKTGIFVWKVKTKTSNSGDVAGNANWRGYVSIWIAGKQYYAHRLAWAFCNGSWPIGDIDHINEDKSDNRISNLRVASRSENMFNRSCNKNNTSGMKGVVFCKATNRWRAQMMVNKKSVNIGRFKTKEAAANAYMFKAKEIMGEFAKC
jgi:hypothetical protein